MKNFKYTPSISRKSSLRQNVLRRDLGMCQCCYNVPDVPEVHHIQPLCIGGKDEVNNMITLCYLCHRFAPQDPDDFLVYQRQGGMTLTEAMGKSIWEIGKLHPQTTAKEITELFDSIRLKSYEEHLEKQKIKFKTGEAELRKREREKESAVILAVLCKAKAPMDLNEIAKRVKHPGLTRVTLRNRLNRLTELGNIARVEVGHTAKYEIAP